MLIFLPYDLGSWRFAYLSSCNQLPSLLYYRQLKYLTTFFVRCAWFSAGVMSQTVRGKQASSKEAPIIVMGPHSSFIDTLGGAICGFPGVISVIENAYIPLINKLFRVCESIYVRRSDPDSRKKAAQELKRRAQANGKWNQVNIFPEGVCSVATAVLPYKLGKYFICVAVAVFLVERLNGYQHSMRCRRSLGWGWKPTECQDPVTRRQSCSVNGLSDIHMNKLQLLLLIITGAY